MSVTFTKLFASITESTVWCEPDTTRLAWITMLAMADSKGRVWGSIPGLANRARISVDSARTAISTFMSPDPDSRTSTNEGRRIEIIDGGWRLLNHEKYRSIRDKESIKESKRKYINTRREKERTSVDNLDTEISTVDLSRDIAEAEAEAEAEAYKTKSKSKPLVANAPCVEVAESLFDKFWKAHPKKVGKGDALKAWKKITPPLETLELILQALSWQRESADWLKDGGQYIPNPATYLNGKRWLDEPRKQSPPGTTEVGRHNAITAELWLKSKRAVADDCGTGETYESE